MEPLAALGIVAALVAAATVIGIVWRAAQGRVRRVQSAGVEIEGLELDAEITLVQLSSELCAPCRATARVLDALASDRPDVAHVEYDVAERPELAARFDILQTPTTLVLDREGRIRARIGGLVRREELAAELDRLLGAVTA